MLTSDLIYTSRSGRYIKPCFIDPSDKQLAALAENLLSICRTAANNRTAGKDLEEYFAAFRAMDSKSVPVNALLKLLDERFEKESASPETDYFQKRKELFSRSANLLKEGKFEEFMQNAAENTFDPYGDLPEFDVVTAFRDITAKELLERFNTALVQAILLKAEKLTVTVDSSDHGELRRMLKYLKFFRLLCDIKKDASGALKLEISGPFALFGPTRKYALNLAAFFPAFIRLKKWELRAEIKNRSSSVILKLDESSQLVSHYRNFSNYVPDEIRLFHRLFAEKSKDWQITGDTPLFIAGKGTYFVPDLSFSGNGKVIHLELFHRWHRFQLEKRLELLERRKDITLMIGIDRSICDEETFDLLTEKYPQAMTNAFRFRDFPGVDTVERMLKKMC